MLSDLTARQIISLADQGASSEEIAKSLELEPALVKLVMSRHEVGSASDRDIDDEQLSVLRKHAFNLAPAAGDEGIQARMTMFLLERDRPSGPKQVSSITAINQALILANGAFEKLSKDFQT